MTTPRLNGFEFINKRANKKNPADSYGYRKFRWEWRVRLQRSRIIFISNLL